MTSDTEEQFRDFLFIHRLNLDRNVRLSHSSFTQPKIPHTRWTRKVQRQKQNEQKFESLHVFFNTDLHYPAQENRGSRKAGTMNAGCSPGRNSFSHHRTNNHKGHRQKDSLARFAISQIAMTKTSPQLMTRSGLRLKNTGSDEPLKQSSKIRSTQPLLKSAKIKTNVNLYKGNFSKFTRKEVIPCFKLKKSKPQSQLSPWDNQNRSQLII